ncbi:MAG TPA: aldo/keto reductase [Nocardioidaceae bacterium]|nr:aldo/keto reductase [Nocardioidaceae bacterium]
MLRRPLGSTGLQVSRLGLGTLDWGTHTEPYEAAEQLRLFATAGGTLIDTAAGYGDGAAESLLGSLLGDTVSRDELVLATKAGHGSRDGRRAADTSRGSLLRCLDESLARLGVDFVDLWQVHAWSDDTPLEETLSALDIAVMSGRARYVGVSGYAGWQTAAAAVHQLSAPGRFRIAAAQVEYSLVERTAERALLPAARTFGVGVLPWAPLGRGVLTGKYRTGIPADSRAASPALEGYVAPYLQPPCNLVVEAVCKAADGLDLSAAEVSLAWVRDRPGVVAPIVGTRTAAQLAALLPSEDVTLPDEIVKALDDVSGHRTGGSLA